METIIIDKPATRHKDPHKAAEHFIDTVVAPRRRPPAQDRETARARVEFVRENVELARCELAASGLDTERLGALAAERQEARRKLAEQAHLRAVEGSSVAADRLRGLLPVIPPAPADKLVDTVTFIRTFLDEGEYFESHGVVVESNMAPGDNWARYRFDTSASSFLGGQSGTGRLSFFTLWQNPRSKATIVQVAAQLIVNAHVSVSAEWHGAGTCFVDDAVANATVRARTTVWRMDSSISAIVADRVLGSVGASGGFFGDEEGKSIEFNDILPGTGVNVPADAYVLIEVELMTDWFASDGEVHLDAQSGLFRVDLPQLVLTLT